MLGLGIALMAILGACSLVSNSAEWQGPVPIDPDLWEVEVDVCGPIEDVPLEWIEGRVINTTDENSPVYDLAFVITYEDGSTLEEPSNTIVEPAGPREAADFSFAIPSSDGKMITSCEVTVVDSVLNYRT